MVLHGKCSFTEGCLIRTMPLINIAKSEHCIHYLAQWPTQGDESGHGHQKFSPQNLAPFAVENFFFKKSVDEIRKCVSVKCEKRIYLAG